MPCQEAGPEEDLGRGQDGSKAAFSPGGIWSALSEKTAFGRFLGKGPRLGDRAGRRSNGRDMPRSSARQPPRLSHAKEPVLSVAAHAQVGEKNAVELPCLAE